LTLPASSSPEPGQSSRARRLLYLVTFLWGVLGVLALFARALLRLAPMAWQPIADGSMTALHIAVYVAWVSFNAYAEGYRAFQKSFCPRVIGRAHHLASNPKLLHALLAPLYCLSLFHANRRGLTLAWVMLAIVVTLVWLLSITPQPWRGIVDGGVVVALAWGAMALVVMGLETLMGAPPRAKLGLPDT
jgi:hypothetical protein